MRRSVCGCFDMCRHGCFLLRLPPAEGRALQWPPLSPCRRPGPRSTDSIITTAISEKYLRIYVYWVRETEKSCLKHLHASWSGRQCRWGNSLLAVRGLTKRLTLHVCRPFQSLRKGQQMGREVSSRGFTGQIPTAGIQQLHLSGGPPASLRDTD